MGVVESRGALVAPELPDNIPEHAQWLGGVGAGSWFTLLQDKSMEKFQYRVQRFSSDGDEECNGLFYLADDIIDMNKPYQFTYLSHCEICTITQEGKKFVLEVINYPS